jgi:hypothetical protein
MKKKKDQVNNDESHLNEPAASYSSKRSVKIFNSFEEQENYNRMQMAALTPFERLQQLRKMINVAYGMYGFDPDNLPKKHKLTFL